MSSLKVCRNVRLNNKYEHTIFFTDHSERDAYFDNKVVATFENLSYLRKKWNIKVQASYTSARSWNYAFTEDSTHPRYYYFITEVNYISDTTVELLLELDVMITYIHMYQINKSYVERNHVTDDLIGVHTLDEGLDLGEYVASNVGKDSTLDDLCVLILTSVDLVDVIPGENEADTIKRIAGTYYNGVFSGVAIQAVSALHYNDFAEKLINLSIASEDIISMWMFPQELVQLDEEYSWSDGQPVKRVVGFKNGLTFQTSRNENPLGYKPRNNKLLTYPFNFLYVTNNSGNAVSYPYERFEDPNNIEFDYTGSLSPAESVKIYPKRFKNEIKAYEHGVSLPPYPTCAWSSDTYKLWLAQNQKQMETSLITSGFSIGGGIVATALGALSLNPGAVAGGGMAVLGGLNQIFSTLQKQEDSKAMPDTAKGNWSSSTNISSGFQNFSIMHKGITLERMKVIDDYFDMFGYKLNRLMLPRIHARENWSYVKTIGANVSGNIPNDDLDKIKSIYDTGVTFWVNGDEIGNYSLSNNPI